VIIDDEAHWSVTKRKESAEKVGLHDKMVNCFTVDEALPSNVFQVC
jgi:hypothetical protein